VPEVWEPDEPLAGERTDLAWTRSAIAFAVCIAVLARRVWPLDRADDLLALGLVAVGVIAWAIALLFAKRVANTTHHGRELIDPHTLKLISAGTFALALAGFVLAWLPPVD
jgi:uncharacterized membrane protein YidH (DUF202 family)